MREKSWSRDAVIVLAATLGALVAWELWSSVGHTELTVGREAGLREVGLGAVVTTALVASAAGALTLRALEATTQRGLTWWTVVAAAACLLSLLGPLGASDPTARVALASLHLVVGGIVLFGLRRAHGTKPQRVA